MVFISESYDKFLEGLNQRWTNQGDTLIEDKSLLNESEIELHEQVTQMKDIFAPTVLNFILDEESFELNHRQQNPNVNLGFSDQGAFTEERLEMEVQSFFAQLEGKTLAQVFLMIKAMEIWKQDIESQIKITFFITNTHWMLCKSTFELYRDVFAQMKQLQLSSLATHPFQIFKPNK